MKDILEKLLKAADQHGEDDDPDHTVGDLQDLLRKAWSIMSVGERQIFLASDEVEQVLEAGARGEFPPDGLRAELDQALHQMEASVANAGYRFLQGEHGFFWETKDEASEDFYHRADAVADAYKNHRTA